MPFDTNNLVQCAEIVKNLSKIVSEVFDLRPSSIISKLDLKKPIYLPLSAYGHMGREDLDVSWEKVDKVDEILTAAKNLKLI